MNLVVLQAVSCRLWVAMDRWYLCKEFFAFLEKNYYDWVTKAKRNTALFRKVKEIRTGKERSEPVSPLMFIRLVYTQLLNQASSGLVSISIPNIYMKQPVAIYKEASLLISNRYDDPKEAMIIYTKRWRIEVFFRTAKQELQFESCHSESEAHHYAHFELLLTAETLLSIALYELNKEKTSDEGYTHGEMVRGLFLTH